MKIKIKISNPS